MNTKELQTNLKIKPATMDDYLTIQNMARFYVYDLSRYCGFISEDWACPADGLYECFDFKNISRSRQEEPFSSKLAMNWQVLLY